ncbi:MAG TPA: restriction endonuclease subunit S, partial [Terriglobales bacterium]|nr:restriction endonuclease subunit S [Terriglobales bacterium]
IVAKIEKMFSELDKGVESLTAAREQLKAYRQSVLKHAFEGKLTEGWRVKNPDKVQTPDQLLARLKASRESVRDVKGYELSNLPPLPSGYIYTYLSNLGDLARGKSKHRPRNDPRLFQGKYPFIQTGEVRAANRTVRDFHQTYNEAGLAQSHLWPKGTLCITIAANIAETAFLGFDACFPDSVVGFTAQPEIALPEYVELFIKAVRVRIEAYAPATAQKNINLTTLENLIIPLCSLEEQKYLVGCAEQILSVADANDADAQDNIARCEALRQSILKLAFSGKLVAQEASDEPAAVLLERIRSGQEGAKKRYTNKNGKKEAA